MSPEHWLEKAWPNEATLPFRRFMELCLYHPQLGYYERDNQQIGPHGDFVTSVSAGPLFGQLLAFQFTQWLRQISAPPMVVEAGAHDGTLARDILQAIHNSDPKGAEKFSYWIVEPSPRRQQRQRTHLEDFAGQVRWVGHLNELPPITGVIFSNELLDAFPVQRLGWDAHQQCWFEWGVTASHGTLAWDRLPLTTAQALASLQEASLEWSDELAQVLPDGYTLDLSPDAGPWWAKAAQILRDGWLLTIDYGLLAEELLVPHRTGGTLRAYRGHHAFADVLNEAGERDLTAHVNFTQLIRAGEGAGLETVALQTQERFLMDIARQLNEAQPNVLLEQTHALQTLVHPDRQPFRVLVQRRPASQASSE